MNISQYILGVRPTLAGLSIRPCLLAELCEYRVTRVYRGAEYRIHVRRTGESCVRIDGALLPGTLLPVAPAGSVCAVEVGV